MSEEKPTDPILVDNHTCPDEDITLRDLFAAAVLVGLLANPNVECSYEASAEDAYKSAAAMLKERAK